MVSDTKLVLSFTNKVEYDNKKNSLLITKQIFERKSWDDMPFDSTEPPPGCLFKLNFHDDRRQIEIEPDDTCRDNPLKGIKQALNSINLELKTISPKDCLPCFSRPLQVEVVKNSPELS
jgi:hypothetical protein